MKGKKKVAEPFPEEQTVSRAFPIVALGASAGGLEALQELFGHMALRLGHGFHAGIQHLSPASKSVLGSILQKHTRMAVLQVEDRLRIEPNRVYLNVQDMDVGIFNGVFHLAAPLMPHGTRTPVDHFFRSLAEDQRERAICVILPGSEATVAWGSSLSKKWFIYSTGMGERVSVSPMREA